MEPPYERVPVPVDEHVAVPVEAADDDEGRERERAPQDQGRRGTGAGSPLPRAEQVPPVDPPEHQHREPRENGIDDPELRRLVPGDEQRGAGDTGSEAERRQRS